MYYVYILRGFRRKFFYKGLTDNLDRRLLQHLKGRVAATRNFRPLSLVFVQACQSRIGARELEKYLKSGSGREIIAEII